MNRRAHWTGRHRLIQWVTLFLGVTLLALVVWNVTRPSPPPPPTVAGSWVGVGSVYDSSSGGADRIAVFLSLKQSDDGQIVGPARECNDHAQTAAFTVSGQFAYPIVTLAFSGVTLRGRQSPAGFTIAGSANGSSIQLNLHRGDQSAFTAACAALLPRADASAQQYARLMGRHARFLRVPLLACKEVPDSQSSKRWWLAWPPVRWYTASINQA